MGLGSDPSYSSILADTKGEMADHDGLIDIKIEHDTFTSDTNTFPSTIKVEDEFLEYKFIYKEEQCMTSEEGISGSRNTENNLIGDDVAGPSSTYALKYEEVDLGVVKMEDDEDSTNELTEGEDRESGDQYSAHEIHRLEHMRTHGEQLGETFDCTQCKKEFSNKRSLDGHIVAMHSNNGEMMSSVTYKIHRCKHCKYITGYATRLTRHMRKHGKYLMPTFDCINCKKKFSYKCDLDSHIVARHSDNDEMMNSVTRKLHRCKHCRYITVIKKHLSRHERTHGEKRAETFHCIQCKKEFLSKQHLDGHIVARHSSDSELMNSVTSKIHSCKHCKYTTVGATTLTHHMRKHGQHLETTFDCIKCDKKFWSKSALDNHIITWHSTDAEMMNSITSKTHSCKHCKFMTVHKNVLTRHMKKHVENIGKAIDCLKVREEIVL